MGRSFGWGVLFWAVAASAAAEPNPYLAQAKGFFEAVDYENCLKRLEQAVRWDNTRAELVEIEIYWGLCQFEDAQRLAGKHFSLALQLDPNAQLPPLTSPKVVELFQTLKASEPPPPPPPPKPPPDAPVRADPLPSAAAPKVEASAYHRRIRPASLGLAGAAVAATGTGILFGVFAQQNQGLATGAVYTSDADAFAHQAQWQATAANVSYALGAACAVAAVVVYFIQGPSNEVQP